MSASSKVGVRERALESFARCQAIGRPFGVLAAAIDDRAILERVLGEAWIAALDEEFHQRIEGLLDEVASGVVAEGGRALVHLPDADVARTTAVAEELLRGFAGWTRSAAGAERSVTVSFGLASSSAVEPRFDPRLVLEVLEGVAAEGLEVAAEAGGARAAHSELYSFLQRGLERREPALLDEQARRVAAARETRAPRETPATPEPRVVPESREHGERTGPVGPRRLPEPHEHRAPTAPPPVGRRPPAPAPAAPSNPIREPGADGLDAPLGDRLGAAVRELLRGASGGRADPLVERSLSALIEARLEEERRRAKAEAEDRYGRQVGLLERRLAKLNSALDETERELERAALTAAPDEGAPSAYRTVQGLAPQDSQFELKRQLMAEIFSANLALARRRAQ